MKKLLFIATIIAVASCEPRQGKIANETPVAGADQDVHEVMITEILAAPSYTYLKADEKGMEIWMAVTQSDIETGKKYYYSKPLEMTNFKSKELDRTFESILFINKLVSDPSELASKKVAPNSDGTKASPNRQEGLSIEPEEGAINIQELYANKSSYVDKTVKVKGLVTKFNAGIMERNWVHIQDGTGNDKNFDLTITTEDMVSAGQIVVFEGIVSLDKDFGYGYKYDLIIEKATLQSQKPEVKVN
jgi:hypothetical protein